MKIKNLCTKLFSITSVLAIATLTQVGAVSLADIQDNPARFGNSSSTPAYAYYVDLPASRAIMQNDPYFAVDGQLIYVNYNTKNIKETYATMYYDRSETMDEIQNKVLDDIKTNYTKQQLIDMGKEGFTKLFAEKLQTYLYDHPQISLRINGTHTYSFDGQLKDDEDSANQNFETLRHPNPVPFGGDSYILALMMYEEVFKTPFLAN